MSFYGDLANTAHELLSEFGAPAQLVRAGEDAAYNPDEGTTTVPVEAASDVTAAVFEYPERMIDGTLIQQGDKRVLMSVQSTLEPRNADAFTWFGTTYTVVNNKKLSPAGENVLYVLQVR